MVKAFCIFVCLQILGELISTALCLPLPGALIGMLILLAWLTLRAELPEALASGADTLHQHLGLFFVPVGVSLAGNIELIEAKALSFSSSSSSPHGSRSRRSVLFAKNVLRANP